jgi:hypothetical protein
MLINYIYNTKGQPEYAVVPFFLWEKLENNLEEKFINSNKSIKNKFNPIEFKGIISHLNLDIENEIQEMRNEWTRNIL